MNEQTEMLAMSKEEATALLIESEIRRMRIENDIDMKKDEIKELREKLARTMADIDQLSILANRPADE